MMLKKPAPFFRIAPSSFLKSSSGSSHAVLDTTLSTVFSKLHYISIEPA
jgi:hypothetical protein